MCLHRFRHPLLVLHPCEPHLEVFLVGPLVSALAMAFPSLLTFRPTRTFTLSALLLSWLRLPACAGGAPPVSSADSREVFSPTALEIGDSTNIRRGYLARLRSAPRFSQPLSAFFFPKPWRPCFMPLTLLGFSPSEPSSLPESGAPLGVRSPPVVAFVARPPTAAASRDG